MAYPFIVQTAFSWIEAADPRAIYVIPLALISIAAVKALALFGQVVLINALSLRTIKDLQSALFAHILKMDIAQLNVDAGGVLVSRFTHDVNLAKEALVRLSTNVFRDGLSVLGALGFMFWSNWKMALVIILLYPLAGIPVLWLGQRVRALSLAAQHQIGELTALLNESIAGAQMIRTFQLEPSEQERAEQGFAKRYHLAMKLTMTKAAIDPFLEILGALALALALAYAAMRAQNNHSAVPELMGFITALAILAPAARALGTLNAVWQEGRSAIFRTFALLDQQPSITNIENAKALRIQNGSIDFANIQFSYHGDLSALGGLTLSVQPGKTLALVGPSGGGKTSIFNLLLRFYDPQSGQISIDGQDICQLDLHSLRKQIALVSQNPILFDDTIAANIKFGKPTASLDEVKAAAKAASALDFIENSENGFDTKIGENGHRLSGGQRQRINIARAILKDAPILLLDEATSALDTQAEQQVQGALAKLSKGRTTLIIAHRLSTVREADQIAVIENGKVAELGDHTTLLAQKGLYAQLVDAQLR